jgi:hypothetical protein
MKGEKRSQNRFMKRGVGLFILLLVSGMLTPLLAGGKKLTADEVVENHLNSIGSAETRAKAVSRSAQGKVTFTERIQHSLYMEGTATLMSEARKHRCDFKFGSPQYPGEQFVFDGKNQMIAMVDQTTRSRLGNFLFLQDEVLREGLWGGALSTAWPLLQLQEAGATVKYTGLRKIDGRQLHELSYAPRKRSQNGELGIKLYFDPETFRHVLTVYSLTMLHGPQEKYDPDQTTVIVEEHFSEFREVDGLTLPSHWEIHYRVEPQVKTQEYEWNVSLASIVHNNL